MPESQKRKLDKRYQEYKAGGQNSRADPGIENNMAPLQISRDQKS
jgi:hypothetical protein